jgi:hypothetical protein
MVRSKRENPDTLQYRQSVQQTKSIHELSKIRNLKDFPIHPKVQGFLPDLPLPSVKGMIGVIARVPTKRSHNNSKTVSENGHHDADLGFTPASTPHIPHDSAYTDDEMLRFEMSSPESISHRDQDFDYEVIEAGGNDQFGFMQTQVPVADTPMSNFEDAEENSISVADHYKGTPPLRSKKKGGRNSSRFSQEIPSEFQAKSQRDDLIPPPIPQKKRDSSPVFAATADMTPTPPPASGTPTSAAPSRPDRRGSSAGKTVSRSNSGACSKRPPSATSDNQSMLDQWHSVRSEMNTRNTDEDTLYTAADTSMADTLVGSDELHSVADTLNDHSDDEYFGEMLPRDRNSRHLEDD